MKKQLLLFVMMLLPITVSAYDFYLDGFYYNLLPSNNEVEVTHSGYYNDYGARWGGPVITIPDTIEYMGRKLAVTAIGTRAFMSTAPGLPYCSGIVFPKTIKHIGDEAFYMFIKSQKIILPENLETIGAKAFLGCELKTISIPSKVNQIGSCAFSHITNIEDIHVDESNNYYDSRDNCKAIIETGTNTIIAGCVNTIIPSSIKHLGDGAFWGVPLEQISINNGVESIGESCFSNCNMLRTIEIANSVKSIGEDAFLGCTEIEYICLPNQIQSIEKGTFWGMKKLKSIVIPRGVTTIKRMAFEGCESLTVLRFPETLQTIEEYAYTNCNGVTSISIPQNVNSIGNGAFRDCVNLTELWVSIDTPISLEKSTFPDLFYRLGTLYVPIGKKEVYQEANTWKEFQNIQEFAPTTVKGTISDSAAITSIYSLNSVCRQSFQKGISIISYSNGKVKKVLLK